jgi:hypothetical protein
MHDLIHLKTFNFYCGEMYIAHFILIISFLKFEMGSHYVAQAGLKLTILLPQSPKF